MLLSGAVQEHLSLFFYLLLPCAVIFTLCVRSILRATLSPLRTLPGPRWARFSRLWYLKAAWAGDFEQTNINLHERYGRVLNLNLWLSTYGLGPIVRIAPGEYSIDDPNAIKIVYGSGSKFVKACTPDLLNYHCTAYTYCRRSGTEHQLDWARRMICSQIGIQVLTLQTGER